eukprot:jgi/Psemu1/37673/gm1.37673_g
MDDVDGNTAKATATAAAKDSMADPISNKFPSFDNNLAYIVLQHAFNLPDEQAPIARALKHNALDQWNHVSSFSLQDQGSSNKPLPTHSTRLLLDFIFFLTHTTVPALYLDATSLALDAFKAFQAPLFAEQAKRPHYHITGNSGFSCCCIHQKHKTSTPLTFYQTSPRRTIPFLLGTPNSSSTTSKKRCVFGLFSFTSSKAHSENLAYKITALLEMDRQQVFFV